MNRAWAFVMLAFVVTNLLQASEDVLVMKDGTTRVGQVVGLDDNILRLRLTPPPGQPAGTVTIDRKSVELVRFSRPTELDAIAKDLAIGHTAAARALWQKQEQFLKVPESHAAEAGLAYVRTLLLSNDTHRHEEAYALASRIEKEAWNESSHEEAKRERLRAMLKLGQIEEAAKEAREMPETSEDPGFILDTKLLLAQTQIAGLKKLLEDNPRWNQDPPVREERTRFINEGLDLALYPFLFHGTEHDKAAEGLWLAHEIYILAADNKAAQEVATDIVTIYPDTRQAVLAKNALKESPQKTLEEETPKEL